MATDEGGDRDAAVEGLLALVRSALSARRAAFLERVQHVERALDAYRRASDAEIARQFAREHGLAQPARAALTPGRAAELLAAAVAALPELSTNDEPEPESEPAASEPPETRPDGAFPRLQAAVAHAKVVVIGALSGRDRADAFSGEIAPHVEWVDTERDGAHAVGNLPQRIRQGRVAGVVILDRAVQHRHTEAVMAAARDAAVPVAFAGKGGRASIVRAAEQLEIALARRDKA